MKSIWRQQPRDTNQADDHASTTGPDRPNLDDPKVQADIMEYLQGFDENAPGAQPHDDHDPDNLNFVTISRRVRATKGKRRIFPKDTEEKMRSGKSG